MKRKELYTFIGVVILYAIHLSAYAQDIENIIDDVKGLEESKKMKVTGGISTNHIFYASNGVSPRRNNPYTYYIQGDLNVSVYEKVNLPFTFAYSNQKFNYSVPNNQQSFNQFGVSPSYKWVKLHGGYRNMTFSPYTLNGHIFLGGGFDLTPGEKLKISGMYGRFQKAVEFDSSSESTVNLPVYKRMGGGLRTSYGKGNDEVTLIFFAASDQMNSLSFQPDSLGVMPKENIVWSVSGKKQIGQNLNINIEYANSAYTRDTRAPGFDHENFVASTGILSAKTSTVFFDALKAGINYKLNNSGIGLAYERIDPEYKTLGAYYFNNDLENITANLTTTFFKKRLNLNANVGVQRNNLDQIKVSTMRRFVGALNLNAAISQKINLTVNYSSFQSFTNIRSQFIAINQLTPYDNLDTLNFTQITQSVNANLNWNLKQNKKQSHVLMIMASLQSSANEQGDVEQNSDTEFYNLNANYNISFLESGLSLNFATNANLNQNALGNNSIFGPTFGANKAFHNNKIRAGLTFSWNESYTNGFKVNSVFNVRTNASMNLDGKHSFVASIVLLRRSSFSVLPGVEPQFNEFTGTLGYNYRF